MLDRIDSDILAALQNDARLSNKELAARVGLAPSSCHERVRRLTARGILRGAHARVETAALGIGLEAMIGVRLARHSRDAVSAFQTALAAEAEVVGIYYLAGDTDFLVQVAVRDADHLRDFVLDRVTSRAEVGRVETSLVFDYARNPVLPNYAGPTTHGD